MMFLFFITQEIFLRDISGAEDGGRKMKKIITLVATIMLLATSTLILAGCGGSTTLEEYINGDSDAQQELSDLESSLGEGGSVTIKDNNIQLIYKYAQTFDEATATAMKPQLEKAMNSMESTFQGMVDDLKDQSGIDDVSMTIIYQDANGTELYSNTYQ